MSSRCDWSNYSSSSNARACSILRARDRFRRSPKRIGVVTSPTGSVLARHSERHRAKMAAGGTPAGPGYGSGRRSRFHDSGGRLPR